MEQIHSNTFSLDIKRNELLYLVNILFLSVFSVRIVLDPYILICVCILLFGCVCVCVRAQEGNVGSCCLKNATPVGVFVRTSETSQS